MPRLKNRNLTDDEIRLAVSSMTEAERISLLDTLIKDFRNRETVAVSVSLEIEKKTGVRIARKEDRLTVEFNFSALDPSRVVIL